MSKLAIVLCAVLLASAVDALNWPNRLAFATSCALTKITMIENASRNAKVEATRLTKHLEAAINSFGEEITDEMEKQKEQVKSVIVNRITEIKNVNVNHCRQFIHDLQNAGNDTKKKVAQCMSNEEKTRKTYLKKIIVECTKVFQKLAAMKDKVHRCSENVNGNLFRLRPISCTKFTTFRIGLVSAKAYTVLLVNFIKVKSLLSTLQSSLDYCRNISGIDSFYSELSRIASRAQICIKNKTDEAPPDALKVGYTTRNVQAIEAAPTTVSKTEEAQTTDDNDQK